MHAQPGILENLQEHTDILLLNASSAAVDARKTALQRLQAAVDAAHAQHVAADLTMTVGFGPTFVAGMSPSQAPKALHPMPRFHGDEFNATDTQTDVVIQICSNVKYANYASADSLLKALAPAFSLATHHQGFGFPGSRGALGFIDGTGNPGAEEGPEVALIRAEDAAFEGGSYMTFRKIVEDVSRWDALSLDDQENAIGRRKRDSEEFDSPGTSHQKKSNVVREGEEVQLLRRSIPSGPTGKGACFSFATSGTWPSTRPSKATWSARTVAATTAWRTPPTPSLGAITSCRRFQKRADSLGISCSNVAAFNWAVPELVGRHRGQHCRC